MSKVNILNTIDGTSVDGPGFRISTYFSGCTHRCPGCHNPESWDQSAGEEWEVEDYFENVIKPSPWNVTFTGGDPIYQYDSVFELAKLIHQYTNKTIWLYTGYTIEWLFENLPSFRYEMSEYIEAVVDGPFIASKRNTDLLFRGSENQRIIYLRNVKDMVEDSTVFIE